MGSVSSAPPTAEQVVAAAKLWSRSAELVRAERALFSLQGYFPRNNADSVLLKLVALQSLDSTRAFHAERWAAHFELEFAGVDVREAGPEFVDRLARAAGSSERERKSAHVIASRFAHYFVDVDRFPIQDSWSEGELLRCTCALGPAPSRYAEFAARHARLARDLELPRARQLWCWLWLTGQYRAWRRNPRRSIHRAARALFEACGEDCEALLAVAERRAGCRAA